MTNHYSDIANADCVLIMGSNAAEHHPISFKWVLKAQDKGGTVIHVDPKFSRTSARSDHHVPLRSGTDIAFLGGMINYIIEKEKYFKEYVVDYTHASFLVNKDFGFKDGLFSGWDKDKKAYDKATWTYQMDENGVPKRDMTLQDPACVFQLMKKHYSRYTLDTVSAVTGVPTGDLLKVYEAVAATGKPDKVATMLYALGWTQHTYGVQIIRTSTLVQLLLGNIGVAGGGINALRGEPNVQGSTDHALLYHYIPGYHGVPRSGWPTLEDYLKANTPVTKDPKSVNWWGNRPKYIVSLLKGWFGDKATKENGFCYSLLPKVDTGADMSIQYLFDRMYKNKIRGGFVFGHNPCQSQPNTHKVRRAMENLDWLVVGEIHHTETSDFWRGPKAKPSAIKTEVFLLPSAQRGERDGTVSNSGRWHLWHYKAVEPAGQCRDMGTMFVQMMQAVRSLYSKDSGPQLAQVMSMDFPEKWDADQMCRRINGVFTQDSKVGEKEYKKGQLVPGFPNLKDDGSTTSLNWLYCGGYTEEGGNLSKRRDLTQTPMQAAIHLFPKFSWTWPVNRRVLYNRASVDKNGKPWNPAKAVIAWDGEKKAWVGDIPDGPAPPYSNENGKYPFIMMKDGFGAFFGPGLADGPFPEHYEPIETPIAEHLLSKQLHNPVAKVLRGEGDANPLAAPGDPRFPIVLTTYCLTEHWCSGTETRKIPALLEAEPQQYVEMSPQLAKEKGIKNGDVVIVESARGAVEAIAMVTIRMRPFKVQGKTVHEIGMPFCFGWTTPPWPKKPGKAGDAVNRLTASVMDPTASIPEYKALTVNIRKASKATEL